jgi:hypothetical protein
MRLIYHATAKNPAAAPITKHQAPVTEICPMGKCLPAVRGFSASNLRSTIRLKLIAAVRAQTIAAKISKKVRHPGQPATNIDAKAKGNANSVWEKRTNPKYFFTGDVSPIRARSIDQGPVTKLILVFYDSCQRFRSLCSIPR